MTTTTTTTNYKHVGVNEPGTSASSSGSWTQMSGGVASMAYASIMKLMDTLIDLQSLSQEIIHLQTQAEAAAAKLAADGTIAAAEEQAKMLYAQCAEAATSALVTGVGGALSFAHNRSLNKQMEEVSGQQQQLNSLNKMNSKERTNGRSAGNAAVPVNEDVAARKSELLRGKDELYDKSATDPNANYSKKRSEKETEEEKKQLDEDAVKLIDSPEERERFDDNLNKEREVLSRKENNIHQQITSNMTKYQLYQTVITQTTTAIDKGLEATYQTKAGQDQAQASISQTNMQMAQQAVNDSIKNKDALASEAIQSLQTLSALAQCSRPV